MATMTNGDGVGNLSSRGSAFADPSSRAPMLDVVCDLWHSHSNPNGYLSLGVAENVSPVCAKRRLRPHPG